MNTKPDQRKKKNGLPYLLFAAISVFAVYLSSINNKLLNWDDNIYLIHNFLIRDLSNMSFVFKNLYLGNYHPLTILSFSLMYHIGGLDPSIYHTVSLIFHTINTLLVFHLIRELFGKYSIGLIVALLFGIHPIHVESVAWASGLKDVQYTFFFLLSLIFYLKFVRKSHWGIYIASLLCFILSLLSKGQAVSLFPVILLIDLIERKKLFTKLAQKLPYFILSLTFGVIAILGQDSDNNIGILTDISPFEQLAFACFGFCMYILKIIVPFDLSPFYSYPKLVGGQIPPVYWLYLLCIPVTIYLLFFTFKRDKNIFFGLAFFIVNIFLVLQLIPIGDWMMADRYSYIPSIGINIIVAYVFYKYYLKPKNKTPLVTIMAVYIIFLGAFCFQQTKKWKDDFTLWDHALSINPKSYEALKNRAGAYNEMGQYEKALKDLNRSIKLNTNNKLAYFNRGVSRSYLGDFDGAIEDFERANSYNLSSQNYSDLYASWGSALANQGKILEAKEKFNASIKLNPYNPYAYNNMGIAHAIEGNVDEALENFDKAIKLNPIFKDAISNRNRALDIKNKKN